MVYIISQYLKFLKDKSILTLYILLNKLTLNHDCKINIFILFEMERSMLDL
jgi:hypothetical protein